jgi:hypothetical protein
MENKQTYGDKIFKLLQKLERNINKPDLHSFCAKVKNGTVYVDARCDGIYIGFTDNKNNYSGWVGTCIAASNRLEMLEIDMDTVEV